MEILCTYTDKNYLPQLLSLIESLIKNGKIEFRIYVLCLDEIVLQVLQKIDYAKVVTISHEQFLNENPNQKIALGNRPLLNYYYTCTPVLIRQAFKLNRDVARVTYIDADMYCMGDLKEYFTEITDKDISILEHRNDSPLIAEHGKFNVSILTFTNSDESFACLSWWEKMTFQSTAFNEKVFGDQKYLDEFPERFKNVHVIQHKGVGTAPWNINRHKTSLEGNNVLIDNNKLIIYHFARLLIVNRFMFIPARRSNINKSALRLIYKQYFGALRKSSALIKKLIPDYSLQYTRHNLRGLILSFFGGRTFFFYNDKIIRIGINIKLFYEDS